MKSLFPSAILASIVLSSCATTTSFINDDVYSVRASELALGESLSDETSYAAFKSRKEGKTNDKTTYSDDFSYLQRMRCLEAQTYCGTCGCTFEEWAEYRHMRTPSAYGRFGNYGWHGSSMRYNYLFSNYSIGFGSHPYYAYSPYNN